MVPPYRKALRLALVELPLGRPLGESGIMEKDASLDIWGIMTFCHKFTKSKAAILDADPVAVKSFHSYRPWFVPCPVRE
jgi:hypothetical protein